MVKTNRGSALVAVLVVTIMLMGMGWALATFSTAFHARTDQMNDAGEATYAAESVLESIWYQIGTSSYDSTGNVWLQQNSGAAPLGVLVCSDVPVGRATVTARVYDIGNSFYRAEATAAINGIARTVAQEFRARDTFAHYLFFVDAESVNFGAATVKGYVHSNQGINFYYGGAKFYKEVTASAGFTYNSGANAGNTSFYGGSNPSAPTVQMPANPIPGLANSALPGYKFNGTSSSTVQVTLMGNQVRLVYFKWGGPVLSDQILPLPTNGLIYTEGNVTIKGDLNGRLTIAALGKAEIKDRIRYVDQDGDLAYQLTQNGTPVPNNDTAPGIVWSEPAYQYASNPAYNPAPGAASALGIIVNGDIQLTPGLPYNMELHAALYSANGKLYTNTTSAMGNFRLVGSNANKLAGWVAQGNGSSYTGWGASTGYLYDENFQDNPPPFYFKINKPMKGSRWVMKPGEVTNP